MLPIMGTRWKSRYYEYLLSSNVDSHCISILLVSECSFPYAHSHDPICNLEALQHLVIIAILNKNFLINNNLCNLA